MVNFLKWMSILASVLFILVPGDRKLYGSSSSQIQYRKLIEIHEDAVVNSVTWSPEGKYIAVAETDEEIPFVKIINENGEHLSTFGPEQPYSLIKHLTWSPDGNYVATSYGTYDGLIHVWNLTDPQDPQLSSEILHQPHTGDYSVITSLVWHPTDVNQFMSIGGVVPDSIENNIEERTINFWDATSGDLIQSVEDNSAGILSANWSPNAEYIAAYTFDGDVLLWKANDFGSETATRIDDKKFPEGTVISVLEWSPDSSMLGWLECSKTCLIMTYHLARGDLFDFGPNESFLQGIIKWNPHMDLIASSGVIDKQIKIWDPVSRSELAVIDEDKTVTSLSWNPQGDRIIASYGDSTVILWEILFVEPEDN